MKRRFGEGVKSRRRVQRDDKRSWLDRTISKLLNSSCEARVGNRNRCRFGGELTDRCDSGSSESAEMDVSDLTPSQGACDIWERCMLSLQKYVSNARK